jgi:hypothetical protein
MASAGEIGYERVISTVENGLSAGEKYDLVKQSESFRSRLMLCMCDKPRGKIDRGFRTLTMLRITFLPRFARLDNVLSNW